MNIDFKKWLISLEETVSFEDIGKIRKIVRKKTGYRPGTFGIEIEFIPENSEDMKKEIDMVGKMIQNAGDNWKPDDSTPDEWGVGKDGHLVEIRSRYLTTKDIPVLRNILTDLRDNVRTSGGTSAHVHIGLQQFDDFNMMDLLSIIYLIDEKKLYDLAGEDRDVRWTKSNQTLIDTIFNIIFHTSGFFSDDDTGEVVVSDTDLRKSLMGVERYMGTNIKAFFTHGTIEFRYLSSQILKNIDAFLEAIQYYLLMPYLARKKMQIKLVSTHETKKADTSTEKDKTTDEVIGEETINTLYFTRMPGNQVKISLHPTAHAMSDIASTRSVKDPSKVELKRKEIEDAKISKVVDYFSDIRIGDFKKTVADNAEKLIWQVDSDLRDAINIIIQNEPEPIISATDTRKFSFYDQHNCAFDGRLPCFSSAGRACKFSFEKLYKTLAKLNMFNK